MTNVKPQLIPAFILHTRVYRDTSLIIEFFTAELGIITAVAKGARNPRSAWRGILMPGIALLISCVGKSDLLTLTHAEMQHTPLALQGNALYSLFYINELLLYLLHRTDPHPNLFHYYVHTLYQLKDKAMLEASLRLFEWKLLQELGYGLNIEIDMANYQAVKADRSYQVISQQGIIEATPVVTEHVYQGATLLALATENFASDRAILREAKHLLRYLLAPLLGNKEIKSRRLFG